MCELLLFFPLHFVFVSSMHFKEEVYMNARFCFKTSALISVYALVNSGKKGIIQEIINHVTPRTG